MGLGECVSHGIWAREASKPPPSGRAGALRSVQHQVDLADDTD